MYETYVTLQGWAGTEVDLRDVGETQCASFRVGATPRRQRGGVWADGETSWYTVNCWRSLARNVAESVRQGDALVVHGRVKVDVWEREGQPPSIAWVVEATFVGHDLSRGTSQFTRVSRTTAVDAAAEVALKELMHAYPGPGEKLNADGEPAEPAA